MPAGWSRIQEPENKGNSQLDKAVNKLHNCISYVHEQHHQAKHFP